MQYPRSRQVARWQNRTWCGCVNYNSCNKTISFYPRVRWHQKCFWQPNIWFFDVHNQVSPEISRVFPVILRPDHLRRGFPSDLFPCLLAGAAFGSGTRRDGSHTRSHKMNMSSLHIGNKCNTYISFVICICTCCFSYKSRQIEFMIMTTFKKHFIYPMTMSICWTRMLYVACTFP